MWNIYVPRSSKQGSKLDSDKFWGNPNGDGPGRQDWSR